MGHFNGPRIVTNGLVLHLDAANPKSYPGSGTTWTNLLPTSTISGTLTNGPTYDSGYGGEILCDGTNDYIGLNNSISQLAWTADGTVGLQTMTIELWFKTSDSNGNLYTKPFNGTGQYNIWISPGNWILACGSGNWFDNIVSFPVSLATGTWQHLVVWMNDTQKGYAINSTQYVNTQNHNQTGNLPSNGNNIGACLMTLYPYGSGWAGNTGYSIQGAVGKCAIYNRVLSVDEISQNFNALRGRYGV